MSGNGEGANRSMDIVAFIQPGECLIVPCQRDPRFFRVVLGDAAKGNRSGVMLEMEAQTMLNLANALVSALESAKRPGKGAGQ